MRRLILGTLRAYQKYVSPLKSPSCRFYPTCSEYTVQAVEKYGVVKGLVLGAKRVARCHPFHPGGDDPVP
ncbi:MAG: membrane protein insertion efficiency factor YidD [Brockia lithotrophica]|nr:membrane protein insertion efficiency factor YidD [Brockia lithotrophica]